MRRTRGFGWTAGLAPALAPAAAQAHAFGTYDGAYNNFLAGAGVFLSAPGLILPVLALAVALGLWREEGLLVAWAPVLGATLVALVAAPFVVGLWATYTPLGFGLVIAGLAALVPLGRIAPAMPVLAALLGFTVGVAALEGHGWDEITWATRFGVLFGLHFTLAAGAGLVRLTRERFPHRATDILWRVIASWLAAILVLYLAFAFTTV